MRTAQVIHMVSCHAEGEVGNVIVGGIAPPPGETLWEQARWIAKDQNLRKFVLNERMIGRSIIDSHFDCAIVSETELGGKKAIIPSIRGRAWITGTHQFMLDPDDPWPLGYRLSDTWPMKKKSQGT